MLIDHKKHLLLIFEWCRLRYIDLLQNIILHLKTLSYTNFVINIIFYTENVSIMSETFTVISNNEDIFRILPV